jgi:Zn-dependent protease with chaperone function
MLVLFLLGLGLLVIGALGSFFGRLIQAAVSRQREFLADSSSVQFTRNPDGIVGASEKDRRHGNGVENDGSEGGGSEPHVFLEWRDV